MARTEHGFQPIVVVESDADGSNPKIVSVDWADSYLGGTRVEDDIAWEVDINDPEGEEVCAWMDERIVDLTEALIREGNREREEE